MHSWIKAVGYGVVVWLVPFVVAFVFLPLRQQDRILFESIMPIAVVAPTVIFSVLYINPVPGKHAMEGLRLGLLWLVICIAIDQVFFNFGPTRMTFVDYLKDIGLTYVMIPFITTGHGLMQQRMKQG